MAKATNTEPTVAEANDIAAPLVAVEHIPEGRIVGTDNGRVIRADPADARSVSPEFVAAPVVTPDSPQEFVAVEDGSVFLDGHHTLPNADGLTPYIERESPVPQLPLLVLGQPRIIDPGDASPVHPSITGPNTPFVR